MSDEKKLTWEQGPSKDDHMLRAGDGEAIAHVYPREGYPGSFTLLTKNHGEWWGKEPSRHFDQLLAAQHAAMNHGKEYYRQEEQNLSEANRFHTIYSLERQWEDMGGDPKVMKDFRAEWDRVSAAHYHVKVADRDKDRGGHER